MVLDAAKEGTFYKHQEILEAELQSVGIRLNCSPPDIYFKIKPTGGVKFSSTLKLTKLGDDPQQLLKRVLQEYKIHNCEIVFREDCDIDQFIDVVQGNRKYVRCVYVFNKIDVISIEKVDQLARRPHSVVISCKLKLNLDTFLAKIWDYLGLVRVYTKKKSQPPSFQEPLVLTTGRNGVTVQAACEQIHKDIIDNMKWAYVWGTSAKQIPQKVGLKHQLHDQDVLQIVLKTAEEQRQEKNYSQRVQDYYDKYHEKKKKKKPLKT
eukprot:TRINITY_DN15584_c0_g1_i1.p1 TRINITY_DN15584_c0_g1~~TRINITY_DN15584_c0_g1_i1.p1  ORF type:complete len:264 (-),score=37.89 TRINITY_DN15584_c0_g1_i1:13-804(-)